jgi:phytoene synthase
MTGPGEGAASPAHAASRSNFYYAFLFLPPQKRDAILAVYGFCHHADDLVDRPRGGVDPRRELRQWRRDVEALYAGGEPPTTAHVAALAPHLAAYPLPKAALLDILEGVEMDLDRKRYATWEELRQYCLRVASAVGLVCIEIFGHRNPRSRDYAVELGVALQLTNILRDVASDARRGRLYLPAEDLERFRVSEEEVLEGRLSGRLRELLAFQCQRARGHFFRADALRPPEDRKTLFAAEIMGRIYFRILERIEARNFDVWKERVAVPRLQKGLIALSVWSRHKMLGGTG